MLFFFVNLLFMLWRAFQHSRLTSLVWRFYSVPAGYAQVANEGKASIIVPEGKEKHVFYNPLMRSNRDLTLCVLQTLHNNPSFFNVPSSKKSARFNTHSIREQGFRILDAHAATGVRAIRMIRELSDSCIHSITVNDIDPHVLEILKANLHFNLDFHDLSIQCQDAAELLKSSEPGAFDIIDLDPYGTPSPLIPDSLGAISDGGILCLTATDMMVLCGASMSTCVVNYDGMGMSGANCHEGALRLLLGYVARCSAKQKKSIRPLLSLSLDHYIRLFIQIYRSPAEASMVGANIGHVFRCTDCLAIHTQPLLHVVSHKKKGSEETSSHLYHPSITSNNCDQCGGSIKMFGPMWLGDLHHKEFMQPLLHTIDVSDTFDHEEPLLRRLRGMLRLLTCELNVPFSHPIFRYASILKTTTPSLDSLSSALLRRGYQVSRSHSEERGVKTNAPTNEVWDVMRRWRDHQEQKTSDSEFAPLEQSEQLEDLHPKQAFQKFSGFHSQTKHTKERS